MQASGWCRTSTFTSRSASSSALIGGKRGSCDGGLDRVVHDFGGERGLGRADRADAAPQLPPRCRLTKTPARCGKPGSLRAPESRRRPRADVRLDRLAREGRPISDSSVAPRLATLGVPAVPASSAGAQGRPRRRAPSGSRRPMAPRTRARGSVRRRPTNPPSVMNERSPHSPPASTSSGSSCVSPSKSPRRTCSTSAASRSAARGRVARRRVGREPVAAVAARDERDAPTERVGGARRPLARASRCAAYGRNESDSSTSGQRPSGSRKLIGTSTPWSRRPGSRRGVVARGRRPGSRRPAQRCQSAWRTPGRLGSA